MGQNFLAADREQGFLLPPDVRDWLPEGHFAWFVIEAVAEMDLAAFYGAYRQDGHGRAAFDPAVMVAVLLYAYARGIRSSRAIERTCEEDVAFRVLAVNQVPDHTTIARFRQSHQDALAGVSARCWRRAPMPVCCAPRCSPSTARSSMRPAAIRGAPGP